MSISGREAVNKFYDNFPAILQKNMDNFYNVVGRNIV